MPAPDLIPVPRDLLERLVWTANAGLNSLAISIPGSVSHKRLQNTITAAQALLDGSTPRKPECCTEPEWQEVLSSADHASRPPIHPITPDNPPQFPCWLLTRGVIKTWVHYLHAGRPYIADNFTHWSPDAQQTPTSHP